MDTCFRPLKMQKKNGAIDIKTRGVRGDVLVAAFLHVDQKTLPPIRVADPTIPLNRLLYEVMRTGNADLPIPGEVVAGFSNCGRGFYSAFKNSWQRGKLLSADVEYPPYLVVPTEDGETRWGRPVESQTEQLLHFIYHLRELMRYLAEHPIGKKTTISSSAVAEMISVLPPRAAFIRSGDSIGVIYTDEAEPPVSDQEFAVRMKRINSQTHAKYTRLKMEIEQEQLAGS